MIITYVTTTNAAVHSPVVFAQVLIKDTVLKVPVYFCKAVNSSSPSCDPWAQCPLVSHARWIICCQSCQRAEVMHTRPTPDLDIVQTLLLVSLFEMLFLTFCSNMTKDIKLSFHDYSFIFLLLSTLLSITSFVIFFWPVHVQKSTTALHSQARHWHTSSVLSKLVANYLLILRTSK